MVDCLTLVLARSNSDQRSSYILDLVNNVYYDAFTNAVTHVNTDIKMFSKVNMQILNINPLRHPNNRLKFLFLKDGYLKEVKRLAVYCGMLVLSFKLEETRNIGNDYVNSLFKDVRRLCETQI